MIILQDCLKWMRSQPAESVDIIVSSPPYNIGISYNTYGDRMTSNDYLTWQEQVWTEACRILRPDGHLFLNISPTRKNPLLPYCVASSVPWRIQNTFIWNKSITIDGHVRGHGNPVSSQRYIPSGWEFVFHFTQSGDTPISQQRSGVPYQPEWAQSNAQRSGRDWRPCTNTWFIPYETNGARSNKTLKSGKKHPAIFPRELVRQCLRVCDAQPDHTIYDPFGGTGTTAVVAQEFGAKWIITEIDSDYVEFIEDRLNAQCAALVRR